MSEVISTIAEHVPSKFNRTHIYIDLIDAFEDADCDTLDECRGEDPAYDTALDLKYPPNDDD